MEREGLSEYKFGWQNYLIKFIHYTIHTLVHSVHDILFTMHCVSLSRFFFLVMDFGIYFNTLCVLWELNSIRWAAVQHSFLAYIHGKLCFSFSFLWVLSLTVASFYGSFTHASSVNNTQIDIRSNDWTDNWWERYLVPDFYTFFQPISSE